MTYNKPEIVILGDAAVAIQGYAKTFITFVDFLDLTDPCQRLVISGYDLDD